MSAKAKMTPGAVRQGAGRWKGGAGGRFRMVWAAVGDNSARTCIAASAASPEASGSQMHAGAHVCAMQESSRPLAMVDKRWAGAWGRAIWVPVCTGSSRRSCTRLRGAGEGRCDGVGSRSNAALGAPAAGAGGSEWRPRARFAPRGVGRGMQPWMRRNLQVQLLARERSCGTPHRGRGQSRPLSGGSCGAAMGQAGTRCRLLPWMEQRRGCECITLHSEHFAHCVVSGSQVCMGITRGIGRGQSEPGGGPANAWAPCDAGVR